MARSPIFSDISFVSARFLSWGGFGRGGLGTLASVVDDVGSRLFGFPQSKKEMTRARVVGDRIPSCPMGLIRRGLQIAFFKNFFDASDLDGDPC